MWLEAKVNDIIKSISVFLMGTFFADSMVEFKTFVLNIFNLLHRYKRICA